MFAAFMKHLVIGQRLKTPNFSAFHWSPRGSAMRVVHLPKSTETISGPNHQLLQLCTARTAWSEPGPIRTRLWGRAYIAVIAGLISYFK